MMNDTYEAFLWTIFALLITTVILITVAYYFFMVPNRHKKIMEVSKDICKNYEQLPKNIDIIFNIVVERRFHYIKNYFAFQITTKVFGIVGVIFSIYGLACSLLNASKELTLCVSKISIISVIVALYLSPIKRVNEYINAWRKTDELVNKFIPMLPLYNSKDAYLDEKLQNKLNKICDELKSTELNITSDCE